MCLVSGVWCLGVCTTFSHFIIFYFILLFQNNNQYFITMLVFTLPTHHHLSHSHRTHRTHTHTNRKSQLMHNFNRPKNRFILLYDLKKVNVFIFFLCFFCNVCRRRRRRYYCCTKKKSDDYI